MTQTLEMTFTQTTAGECKVVVIIVDLSSFEWPILDSRSYSLNDQQSNCLNPIH